MADTRTRIINLPEATTLDPSMNFVEDSADGSGTRRITYDTLKGAINQEGAVNLAPAYSNAETYNVGDLCTYQGRLYSCVTQISTAEDWTPAHWTAVNMSREVSQLKSDLTQLIKTPLTGYTMGGANYIQLFSASDPDFLDGYGYSGTTTEIITTAPWCITGYIPVYKGETVTFSTAEENTRLKVGLYDANKNIVSVTQTDTNVTSMSYTATDSCFVRFQFLKANIGTASIVVNGRTKIKLDAVDGKVQSMIEQSDAIYGDSYINYAYNDSENYQEKKGYSGTTSSIVTSPPDDLTGYIYVNKGDIVKAFVNGENVFSSSTMSGNRKMGLYDSTKTWVSTTNLASGDHSSDHFTMPYDGYLRFQFTRTKELDVNINGLKQIDGNVINYNPNMVDVIIFMGQSNMAGRGITNASHTEDAPPVICGAGWEFRAITDPTHLHEIDKTFGLNENVAEGIDDSNKKTGGMVPSFINAYYTHNGKVPVIGVSASEGASSITAWQPNEGNLVDAINRLETCLTWVKGEGYNIRHTYMVWCQGEADVNQTEAWYADKFATMFSAMQNVGVEKCFLVRIGNYNPERQNRIDMMEWQNHICQTTKDVVMVSTDFASMLSRNMMKDEEHYYQDAYNEVGTYAGLNTAYYVMTGKEPTMYDPQFDDLYYSHKN